MQNGIHENLPRDEVPPFLKDLLGQASDDGVSLAIDQRDNGDGTVRVAWTVADPQLPGVVTPTVPPAPPIPMLDSPDPPPPGVAGPFVSARTMGDRTILYLDAKGRGLVRQGGTRSWRNCNPGNIQKGVAETIGDDGRFAVFPDEPTGHRAIVTLLLSNKYRSLSLRDAIFMYAPPNENDSDRYLRFVVSTSGVAATTITGSLPPDRLNAVADVIKTVEGWTPGTERPNAPLATMGAAILPVHGASRGGQEWMDVAQREAALPRHERSAWPDPGENPRILDYFRVAAAWFEAGAGDEVDWCAAFVNYCLVTSGHLGTDHPGARSFFWNRGGHFMTLAQPQPGAIAVLRRAPFDDARWTTGPGHVAFVTGVGPTSLTLLGGNQGACVCEAPFERQTHDAAGQLTSTFVAFLLPAPA